jgi:hypothetical protein
MDLLRKGSEKLLGVCYGRRKKKCVLFPLDGEFIELEKSSAKNSYKDIK